MRGALPAVSAIKQITGIIPAYAGSTQAEPERLRVSGDHPRVCGEHHGRHRSGSNGRGSSPRMRGARLCGGMTGTPARIIPAYAGSTVPHSAQEHQTKDHPRVCGEHEVPGYGHDNTVGSSPRMRGAHQRRIPVDPASGIIPAYAGSTGLLPLLIWYAADHPRVCGEHEIPILWKLSIPGSSPRMRGALLAGNHDDAQCGIIPAYAGSTAG